MAKWFNWGSKNKEKEKRGEAEPPLQEEALPDELPEGKTGEAELGEAEPIETETGEAEPIEAEPGEAQIGEVKPWEAINGVNHQELEETGMEPENPSVKANESEPRKKAGLFDKLREGLKKTRESITNRIDQVLVSFGKINDELFEELEEVLITSDMGMETSMKVIAELKAKVKSEKITDTDGVRRALKEIISSKLTDDHVGLKLNTKPSVIVIIGVNGVGKTTSIGKIAHLLKSQGKKVTVAAADTFRAAAIDQLEIWTKRAGVELVKHNEGADPSAVIYDAVQHCKSKGSDVLICDTAGRLHTKKNLMEELKKIFRILTRELPDADIETLLVLDATTGQNAVSQAKTFSEVSELTGLILTKLDGTAKGGIVVSIKSELDIPVKFVGVGEQMNDLQPFNPADFVEALFGVD